MLITGASRGIGRAAALRLAGLGWDVFAGVRRPEDGESLANEDPSKRIVPVVLDVTDGAQIAALDEVLPKRLDALVNNAGIVVSGPIEGLAIDELRQQLEVNVIGQVAVTQALLPRLRDTRGRIVFISSVSGRVSAPLLGPYSASKFALEGLVDALRLELRRWGIQVVLIEPGTIDTDLWRLALDTAQASEEALSAEHRTLYAKHLAGARKMIPRMQKQAASTDTVTASIVRALTASRPRARYLVGADARGQVALTAALPTRASDAIIARLTGTPSR